jgi:hypothetical protein
MKHVLHPTELGAAWANAGKGVTLHVRVDALKELLPQGGEKWGWPEKRYIECSQSPEILPSETYLGY